MDNVPEVLAARTQDSAAATAVVYKDISVSQAELDARAQALADALLLWGVGPEAVVAVAVPRGVGAIVGMLGASRAGAAFLPIDPSYPSERIGGWVRTESCCTTAGQPPGAGSSAPPIVRRD